MRRTLKSYRAQTQPPDLERVRWMDTICSDGTRKTRWTRRGYEQTARVRCMLWPKTNYEWYEVWPNPPEITEAEVDTMLDNIDLDFDQIQTTSTKQKYTNCTNDTKSASKGLKDLKGHAAAIEYYNEVFYLSSPNLDGTENRVWIELSPEQKTKLGQTTFGKPHQHSQVSREHRKLGTH